jgi:hypothetical protein
LIELGSLYSITDKLQSKVIKKQAQEIIEDLNQLKNPNNLSFLFIIFNSFKVVIPEIDKTLKELKQFEYSRVDD